MLGSLCGAIDTIFGIEGKLTSVDKSVLCNSGGQSVNVNSAVCCEEDGFGQAVEIISVKLAM